MKVSSVALLLSNVFSQSAGFTLLSNGHFYGSTSSISSALKASFLNDIKDNFGKNFPSSSPKVELPPNFKVPEPKPLTVTRSSDIPSLLKSSVALGLRLATGVFVLGWKIDSLFAEPEEGKYALKLGPLRLRDASAVLKEAPRPGQPLIIYEYEASPFCRRVREVVNLLDLTVEYRPCPGATTGFSNELFERTGRRTVPYMVDPNTGTEMFESDDQIAYMLDNYGPDKGTYDEKSLWPITFKTFSVASSGFASIVRDFAGSRRQPNARSDNEKMIPLELWG